MTGDLDLCECHMAKYLPRESEQVISLGTIDIASTAALPKMVLSLARVSIVYFCYNHAVLFLQG